MRNTFFLSLVLLLSIYSCKVDKKESTQSSFERVSVLGTSVLQITALSRISKHVKIRLFGDKAIEQEHFYWDVNSMHTNGAPWTDTLVFIRVDSNRIDFFPKPFNADSTHQYFEYFSSSLFGDDMDQFYFKSDTVLAIADTYLNGKSYVSDQSGRSVIWSGDFGVLSFQGYSWESTFELDNLEPIVLEKE